MTRFWLFNALQLAVSGYAFRRGGAPERLTGLALLIASLSGPVFFRAADAMFLDVETGFMVIDVVLLAVLIVITLHADRFWPVWITALHALGTGAHLARAINPDVIRAAYAFMAAVWSYPIMLVLVIGTFRHSRRVRSKGWELDWSRQDPIVHQRSTRGV